MKKTVIFLALFLFCLALAYSALWYYWARQINQQLEMTRADLAAQGTIIEGMFTPVTGFPGPMTMGFTGRITNQERSLVIPALRAQGFFLPGTILQIDLPQGLQVQIPEWDFFASTLDELHVRARVPSPLPASLTAGDLFRWREAGGVIAVSALSLRKGELHLRGKGDIGLDEHLQPVVTMPVEISGHMDFLMELQMRGIIENRQALLVGAVMAGLSRKGPEGEQILPVNLTIQKSTLYAGPIRIVEIPPFFWPE